MAIWPFRNFFYEHPVVFIAPPEVIFTQVFPLYVSFKFLVFLKFKMSICKLLLNQQSFCFRKLTIRIIHLYPLNLILTIRYILNLVIGAVTLPKRFSQLDEFFK